MTQPTFQELLTSQEARDRAARFQPVKGNGSHFMCHAGRLYPWDTQFQMWPEGYKNAVWQGWLTDCAPPPEPRVFKRVEYRNVYEEGIDITPCLSRAKADGLFNHLSPRRTRLACVRVEITATEGQFDD